MISIQIIDDIECFKWCLVRYLNPADHNPARITKADKDFAKKLFLKDMTSPVKVRYIQKIEKKKKKKKNSNNNSICISVFNYESKDKHSICVSKRCCEEKHVDLLLIE